MPTLYAQGTVVFLLMQAHRLEIKIWNLKMEVREHLNRTTTEPCGGSDCFSSSPHHWRDNLIFFNVTPAEMESLYLFVLIKKRMFVFRRQSWTQDEVQRSSETSSTLSSTSVCFHSRGLVLICGPTDESAAAASACSPSAGVPDSGISFKNHCQHAR